MSFDDWSIVSAITRDKQLSIPALNVFPNLNLKKKHSLFY